jgi:hypothetical protein
LPKNKRIKKKIVDSDESDYDSEDEKETPPDYDVPTAHSDDEDIPPIEPSRRPRSSRDVGTNRRFPTFPGLVVAEDGKVKDMSETSK